MSPRAEPQGSRPDVVIVGGGPAGSTAARLLARWGVRVAIVTRETPARAAIAESLPPSCRSLYRHLEIEAAIDGAGFQPTTGNTVWWGPGAPRVEGFADGATGHQVSSHRLEGVLLELAEQAGAEIRRGQVVEVRDLETDRPTVRLGDAGEGISAPWVLDASGRAGVLGRRWRRRVEGAATLALTARYEATRWDLRDPTHTLVESYGDGWAWSVPLSPTERFAAVMVDPRRTALGPRPEREALFSLELAKTRELERLFAAARRVGPVRACDASSYTSERFAGRGFLLLGDAGSFIDPLSSYGVKKAMASGWLAAVCVHTCLRRPQMEPHALGLYERRERLVFDSYSRRSAEYSRLAGTRHDSEFWSARSQPELDRDPATSDLLSSELDPARLRDDPAVRSSFERLRRLDRLALRRGPGVELTSRPLVVGREVVLADHLVCAWAPDGIRYLRGVDLTRLVTLAPGAGTVPDLLEAYQRTGPPTELPDLMACLAVCLAKGLLELPGSRQTDRLTRSTVD